MTASRSLVGTVRHTLGKLPGAKPLVNSLILKKRQWDFQRRMRKQTGESTPRTILVDPARVRFLLKDEFQKWRDKGKVLGGDWDRNLLEFDQTQVYRSLVAHFRENKPWEETDLYQWVVKEIEAGRSKWHCENREQIDERYRGLDALWADIKTNGFKTQDQTEGNTDMGRKMYDEVSVSIGRDGQILFDDGRHRLSMAKILGLKEIPVQVTVRHEKWQAFRESLLEYAFRHKGKVYAPLLHPDLADIPSEHGHERFDMILNSLPVKTGDVLDIGSHWGYFSHRFEDAGFRCWAVEFEDVYMPFLKGLRTAGEKQFQIVPMSIFDFREKTDFAVVLALNIFHHFIKTEELHQKLVDLLGRLDMQCLVLGTHNTAEGQMEGAYRNYEPEAFAQFIVDNSCLEHFKKIGETRDGRDNFVIWK